MKTERDELVEMIDVLPKGTLLGVKPAGPLYKAMTEPDCAEVCGHARWLLLGTPEGSQTYFTSLGLSADGPYTVLYPTPGAS